MSISRFHCAFPLDLGQPLVQLTLSQSHHALRVLRLIPGNSLALFDGSGREFLGQLEGVGNGRVRVRLHQSTLPQRDSSLQLGLAQCLSGGDKMDWTFQKAVELGITSLVPLHSARSVVRLDSQRAAARHSHWQRIVESACEQSGRCRIPAIAPVQGLIPWLEAQPTLLGGVVLSPHEGIPLTAWECSDQPITWIVVGPEGGLTPTEEQAAVAHGLQRLRLGPRVLRTETAALALLAILQAQWGDLNPKNAIIPL